MIYIGKFSNNLTSNKKALIFNVSKRILSLSSNIEIFNGSAAYYNKALAKSGYKDRNSYLSEQEIHGTQ